MQMTVTFLINIAAFVGSVPVNVSQSIGSVTRADDIPGVTSNDNQAAAHCDAGQAAISGQSNGGLSLMISVNIPRLVDALQVSLVM